jgi:hypothetical protein
MHLFHINPYSVRCIVMTAMVGLSGLAVTFPGRAAAQATGFSQHQINEHAAACINAQKALKGLTGRPKPGEQPAAFGARIRSYLAALEAVAKKTESLRRPPSLRNTESANLQRWQGIGSNAAALPGEIAEAKAAWQAQAKLGDKAKLGPKLLKCLGSVQRMLNLLRDARL